MVSLSKYLFLKEGKYCFFKKILFIYFQRVKGGRKRGRETSVCGCLSSTPYWGPGPQPGDLAHNPGTCPDWELNQRPFASQPVAQSTESHQPGLSIDFVIVCICFERTLLLSTRTNLKVALRFASWINVSYRTCEATSRWQTCPCNGRIQCVPLMKYAEICVGQWWTHFMWIGWCFKCIDH